MLSQNKKIIISALTLFIFSFTSLMLFLMEHGDSLEKAHVSVSHSESADKEPVDYLRDIDSEVIQKVESSEKVAILTGGDGKILYSNEMFCELLNVDCEEINEYSFFDLIEKEYLIEFIAAHTQIIQNQETKEGIGPFLINGDNKELIVMMSIEPIVKKDKIKYLFVEIDDITEKINEIHDENTHNEMDLKIHKFEEKRETRYTVENNEILFDK